MSKVYNDLLLAADEGQMSALCLLDLTAAFDTVDCHNTVSRLVLCRGLVIGYSYILNNFVVYREPHLIGPFECAVYARKRAIGQAPLY